MWHLHRQVMTLTMLLAQKIIETLISYRSNSRWNFLLWEQRRKEPTASWKYKTRKDLSIRAYINAFMPVYLRLFNNQILLSYLSYWVIKGCSYSKEKSVESIWIKAIWCQNVHSAKFVIWTEKAQQRRPNDRSLHYFGTILPRENVTRNLIFAFSLKIVARRCIIRGKWCQWEIGPD